MKGWHIDACFVFVAEGDAAAECYESIRGLLQWNCLCGSYVL
jgi:hypothetical protein